MGRRISRFWGQRPIFLFRNWKSLEHKSKPMLFKTQTPSKIQTPSLELANLAGGLLKTRIQILELFAHEMEPICMAFDPYSHKNEEKMSLRWYRRLGY